MRPALLYGDMQSVVGFSVIPKCMTLNDLDWLFRVKILFSRRFGWPRPCDSEKNNCVKINKDRDILPAAQIFGRDSSFWPYKVYADVRSGSLERRRYKGQCDRTLTLLLNTCSWFSKTIA